METMIIVPVIYIYTNNSHLKERMFKKRVAVTNKANLKAELEEISTVESN